MVSKKTLDEERIKELKAREIDLSDIPEVKDFSSFQFRNWKPAKKAISFRIDMDNLEWLKQNGEGYQKRMNDVLRWARQNGCPLA